MAALLSNLGIMAEWSGDHEQGLGLHERALTLRRELGDRWAIAVSMTNIGMNAMHRAQPVDSWSRSARQCGSIRRWATSGWSRSPTTTSAMRPARSRTTPRPAHSTRPPSASTRDYADRWALALLLEDVLVLGARIGLAERALVLLGATDRLRERCGSPRGDALEAELGESLEAAVSTLAPDERSAARARGRSLELEPTVEAALELDG